MIKNVINLFLLFLALSLAGATLKAQPSPSPSPKENRKQPATAKAEIAEEVGEGDVIRVNANLVSVPVIVMNREGHYVVDLNQSDFRIFEDGKEQAITHFSNVDNPFWVALLIDTSGSTAPFLDQIKAVAKTFVGELKPIDKVLPVYFHGEVKSLIGSRANDLKALRSAIDQMQPGAINMGTRLYDAVDFGMSASKRESGRKAIILLTDGDNTWGKATMKGTLRDADESDAIIYAVQYGDGPPQKYLQQLAHKTGGRYFKAGDINLINQSFAGVAEELRRQYRIGYYAKPLAGIGQKRKIAVKVNRNNVAVRSRDSYNR
ncbi:MAG TPA: VWA domain-containing protein [Pyrinomonadaceae bacterium]